MSQFQKKFPRLLKRIVFLASIGLIFSCGGESVKKNEESLLKTESIKIVKKKKKKTNIELFTAGMAVGFDLDDTLLFSTPTFRQAESWGFVPDSQEYWAFINVSDEKWSVPKKKTLALLQAHLKKKDKVFILSERPKIKSKTLLDYIVRITGVKRENIFLGLTDKTQKMVELRLNFFYGDSDSDMAQAIWAGVKPYRIKRNPESAEQGNYRLGLYFEEIIEDSEE